MYYFIFARKHLSADCGRQEADTVCYVIDGINIEDQVIVLYHVSTIKYQFLCIRFGN